MEKLNGTEAYSQLPEFVVPAGTTIVSTDVPEADLSDAWHKWLYFCALAGGRFNAEEDKSIDQGDTYLYNTLENFEKIQQGGVFFGLAANLLTEAEIDSSKLGADWYGFLLPEASAVDDMPKLVEAILVITELGPNGLCGDPTYIKRTDGRTVMLVSYD